MRIKILNILTAAICILFGQTARAQYIVNPSFENGTNGWTVSSLSSQSNNSFTLKEGTKYLEKWVSKGNAVGSASVKQTLTTLEPGKYTLTVAAQNLDQNDETKKCYGAKIYAGSASTQVFTTADYTVEFTHIAGEVEVGFSATGAGGNWIAVDNFRLEKVGMPDIADVKSALNTLLATAKNLYGDGSGINAATLKTAIDAAQAAVDNADETSEHAIEVMQALQSAIDAYKYDNVSEAMPLDVTQYITNASFENGSNGWVNEGMASQTNSSFTRKSGTTYLEKWVSVGNPAGDASVSQTVKALPFGKYKLTVAAQNYDQGFATRKCDGAYIFAGETREPVYTPNDYSVIFTAITGDIEIGFRAEAATGNWLSVDNFRLYLVGHVDVAGLVEEVFRTVTQAESLQSQMMSRTAADALVAAIAAGKTITAESTEADIVAAKKNLDTAIRNAMKSIAEYQALANAISRIKPSYDENKAGAADFKAEIDKAEALVANPDATSEDLAAEITLLERALFIFNLANATPGSGTPVKVTETNHYVPTGSTEALVRATMTGSNILERGVCWSTEHEPTVLDSRTTKSFDLNGYIFHIKGLETATVYYVRPYVLSKTYEVAYGDELKIVTHPKGTCKGTWNEGAPTAEANTRCRNAINETIEYFNQWTGIKGFTLTGNYGADTPTADCSYGGWMRIGPNAGNQAIGTVIHETGHGVGVGTHARWRDTNVHNWEWFGREANEIYHFLENKYTSEYVMVGDGTHGWGANATYDWFVNGADKDKHYELQYIGGCCLLYGLFIDGLCPTSGYSNGIPGYTYNFDESKKYYIMNKNANLGLGDGLLYQRNGTSVGWRHNLGIEEVSDSAAWYVSYAPETGLYQFKNVKTGNYITHTTASVGIKKTTNPASTEGFQLMPDRKDVTIGKGTEKFDTHGYWFCWDTGGAKSMTANTFNASTGFGTVMVKDFDFSDNATAQQWILISEDELVKYQSVLIAAGVEQLTVSPELETAIEGIYAPSGMRLNASQHGVNIIRYKNGTSKKIFVE